MVIDFNKVKEMIFGKKDLMILTIEGDHLNSPVDFEKINNQNEVSNINFGLSGNANSQEVKAFIIKLSLSHRNFVIPGESFCSTTTFVFDVSKEEKNLIGIILVEGLGDYCNYSFCIPSHLEESCDLAIDDSKLIYRANN